VPRILLCFAAIAAFALPCRAQQTRSAFETLIRLNVRPVPAPIPALRYRLLPELKEMHPGNPIQSYMKCIMEQKKFFFDEEGFQHREKLLTKPLEELPAEELAVDGRYDLSQIDWAARLDSPDWQVLRKLKADGMEVLLHDVQGIRALNRAIKVRFQAEIAQSRFDDAIRSAKTLFAMSRHLGEHPTLIGNLVGMAIAAVAIDQLEKMLDQPGCPNLYWALTNLRRPLISLDKGMDGERVMMARAFRDLNDSAAMSVEQIKDFIAHMDKNKMLVIGEGTPTEPGARAGLDARTKDDAVVSAARQRLIERGLSAERLLRFPADQVILLDEKRELEERFDDVVKTIDYPFWQVEALNAQIELKKPLPLFSDAFLPRMQGARRAQGRVDQLIGLLRHVEALRLYAAEHDGTLPAKLCDVPVPLPVDPFTGKPFHYEVTGNTAHLRGTPPAGLEKELRFNMHYEVTLQK
jgi:hypothetical protein